MLKIGIIGLGSMGKNHVRVCSELPNVEVSGVADIDTGTGKKIAEQFNTQHFENYQKMIPHIDAAIIATPTSLHHSIAMDLLNHGKHLLIEKPICETTKKAEEIVKTAEKQKIHVAIGHIERYNPAVQFVKEGINTNKFGDLISLTSKRVSNFPGRIRDVGVIFDFGIHDIDVMRYLAGDVQSVYATAGKFNKSLSHEDHANIILNFMQNKCGVIEVNWLTPVKIRRLSLTCSEYYVEVDYMNQSVTMSSSSFKQINEMDLFNVPIQHNINQVSLEKKEPLRNEIIDFIQSITKDIKPLVSADDGYKALQIAEAAQQSYQTGKMVKLQ